MISNVRNVLVAITFLICFSLMVGMVPMARAADDLEPQLPDGFTREFLIAQLTQLKPDPEYSGYLRVPDQDDKPHEIASPQVYSGYLRVSNLAYSGYLLVSVKAWPLRPNSYVAMVCLSENKDGCWNVISDFPAVWFGVFEKTEGKPPQLIARTDGLVNWPTDWSQSNIDIPQALGTPPEAIPERWMQFDLAPYQLQTGVHDVGLISWLVNGGSNGYSARQAYAKFVANILFDQPYKLMQSENFTLPRLPTPSSPFPPNHNAQLDNSRTARVHYDFQRRP
jgi:hypothetical protein